MNSSRSTNAWFNARGPIARGTILTSGVLGLRLILQAGTLLIVARMLGPHRFGAFAGVAAFAVVLGTLSTFGTHLVLLGDVSREPKHRDEILRYAVPSTVVCGGLLFVIFMGVSLTALREAGMTMIALVAIGATEMWLQPLFNFPASEHLALGRTARSQLLITLPLSLRMAAAAVVLLGHPGDLVTYYACGYFLASAIALVVATATMPGKWPRLINWRPPSKIELRHAAGYGVLNITAAGPAELDKTLAARLLPLEWAGVYAAGARVIGAATLPVIAMMLSALPRLFRQGLYRPERTTRLIMWIFGFALTYSASLAVGLWFTAPLFDLLFGTKYRGLDQVIRWLSFAVPGMALRIAAGSILMALGKPWMRVGFEITGIVTLIATSILLTSLYGAVGMPIALACCEWSMTVTGLLLIILAMKNRLERDCP